MGEFDVYKESERFRLYNLYTNKVLCNLSEYVDSLIKENTLESVAAAKGLCEFVRRYYGTSRDYAFMGEE